MVMGTNLWLPQRGSAQWLKTVAATDPTGAPNSAVPSAASDRPRAPLIWGMWATHDEATTACAIKTAVTATFARRSCVASQAFVVVEILTRPPLSQAGDLSGVVTSRWNSSAASSAVLQRMTMATINSNTGMVISAADNPTNPAS
jgi:hypothetical protein